MLAAEALTRIQEALGLAAEALKPFERVPAEVRLKAGGELVTEADEAVNGVLQRVLVCRGEGWLSEESADDLSRLKKDRVWIVDPIDGTREFVAGIPEWAISIALVERGSAIAGGVMNPATGESFLGAAGLGFRYLGEDVPPCCATGLRGATVLASRSEVKRGEWETFRNCGFAIRPTGSAAYKLARVAAGMADATWTLTPKHEWDVAAGVALMEASGEFVSTLDFQRPQFNRADALLGGLVACRRQLGGEVVKLLRPHIARELAASGADLEPMKAGAGAARYPARTRANGILRTSKAEVLATGKSSEQGETNEGPC